MALKIVDLRPVALTAPYVRPDTPPGHRANGSRNCVWLRMEVEDGTVGWGEAYWGVYATGPTIAALERFRGCLIGADAMTPDAVLADLRFRTRYWAFRGVGAQATSAVEGALWDIAGKVAGKPTWELLGGVGMPVLAYASAGDDSLGPSEIHDQALRYVNLGYRGYKMRCGGRAGDERPDGLSRDVERVAAARAALGPARLLMVDVSVPQRRTIWPPALAEAYVDALEPYGLAFLEEPAATYDVDGYRALQSRGSMPIAGGESFTAVDEYEPFFAAGAYGVVQPDAAVVGGPASCLAVARRAHEHGVAVAVHAWSAGVGLAQNLHAAVAAPEVLAIEWPQSVHPTATIPIGSIVDFQDGYLLPPRAPGLGVEISESLLEAFPLVDGFERDF